MTGLPSSRNQSFLGFSACWWATDQRGRGDCPCWPAGSWGVQEVLNRGEQSDPRFLVLLFRVCISFFVFVLEFLPYVVLSFAMKWPCLKGPTVSCFSQLFRGSVMGRCVKVCIYDQCLQEFLVLLVYLVSERNNLIPMELFWKQIYFWNESIKHTTCRLS